MHVDETVTYLEMTAPAELIPPRKPVVDAEVKRVEIPCPELNRYFYMAVGGEWNWIDRLPWSHEQWLAYVTRPGLETWVAYLRGTPAGYFELDGESAGDIELAYFGILPQFVGQGLGGYLLTAAVNRAWEKLPKRVWVHTSSFDHPQALPNYLARGFRIVKRETAPKELPDPAPPPATVEP
jgi:ribosomal protein S18 acetylase RimI-like enzyme